jgi:hypothetical protein
VTSRVTPVRPRPPALAGAGERARDLAHDYGPALGVAVFVLLLVCGISLLTAGSAQALDLNPIHWVSSLAGDIANASSSIFVRGFVAILNSLFSGLEAKLTLHVLSWLTSIDNQSGGHVTSLYNLTSGMAIGLLAAVLTVSIVRYWLAGLSLSGSGGFEAIEALFRTLAAVGFLMVWPFLFGQLVALSNVVSSTILGDPALRAQIAHIINTVVLVTFTPGGAVGLFISIVVAVAGGILFLGLLFMKVLLGAMITFLYVAMPLACILWPIDELSWIARFAMRAFMAALIVPVVWALIFATFAAVSVNALEFQGSHGFMNQVTQPLVAIAMLWMTITIPRTLVKLASNGIGLGGHGGGFFSRAGSYLAARQGGQYLAQAGLLPFGQGGFASQSVGSQTNHRRQSAPTPTGGGGANPTQAGAPTPGGRAPTRPTSRAPDQTKPGQATTGSRPDKQDPPAETPTAAHAPRTRATDNRPAQAGPGRERAEGPAVGPTRPVRDNPNPVAARPPGTAANGDAHAKALGQAKTMPPPSVEQAHAATRRLGPDVREHMAEALAHGGPQAVQAEMARLATSDRISNPQAGDFMILASASEHIPLEGLLGTTAPPANRDQTTRSVTTGTDGPTGSSRPAQREQSPPSAQQPTTGQSAIGEPPGHSSDVEARDEAWRRGGTGVNPRQD